MKLTLTRTEFTDKSTIGKLYIDGVFECFTLEDRYREKDGRPVREWKVQNSTAIPKGTYRMLLTHSPRFKRVLPILLDVQGFTGIRIHSGNVAEHTEGCILVGGNKSKDRIMGSSAAFRALFSKLEKAKTKNEEILIEVK